MKFQVLPPRVSTPRTLDEPFVGLLRPVSWDDHDHHVLFHLSVRLGDAKVRPIGLLKILQLETKRPQLPSEFEQLEGQFCSIGQDHDFYKVMREAFAADAQSVLCALRDLTALPASEREPLTEDEQVRQILLRLSSARHAYLEELGERPSEVNFRISHQVRGFARRHDVSFRFSRERILGRIVVLVGQNGTGKTQLLSGLIHPVLGLSDPKDDAIDETPPLSRLILLSFSAFDRFRIPRRVGDDSVIPYVYCGLRHYVDPMGSTERVDVDGALRELDSAHEDLVHRGLEDEWKARIRQFGLRPPHPGYFATWVDERSAGQKFVCFVLTMLLAKLRPGALVLFDEPELHTHPKMLALLMRQFGEILRRFDAFAIIATHSPIVLQEVPARQVRVIQASDDLEQLFPRVFEYPRECFGESLDEIIKSGFGVEIKDTNYMNHLRELIQARGAEAVEAEFRSGGLSTQLAIAWAKKSEGDDA